ncbi:hypothetical protein T439DRAFT_378988 [Meredithblackwellia eburnea MCA 4105]
MGSTTSPSTGNIPESHEPKAWKWKNPFEDMDSSKKYTLVFLVSMGTTLLVTGASGGRLLKRAKTATATPTAQPAPTPSPLYSASAPTIALKQPPRAPKIPLHQLNAKQISTPTLFTTDKPKHWLKSWRFDSPSYPSSPQYFLPNATILNESNKMAIIMDREDKVHMYGPEAAKREAEEDEKPIPDDGFNPAFYAFKALAIATAITFTSFGVAIGGVMYYFGVNDLESLSLALSHTIPSKLASRRPNLPTWLQPSSLKSSPSSEEGEAAKGGNRQEEDEVKEEDREGVAYWVEVKETLDREAEESKERRRKEWESLKAGTGAGSGQRLV